MSITWPEIKEIMTDPYTKCCYEPIFISTSPKTQKEKRFYSSIKKIFENSFSYKKLLICNLCKVLIHYNCRANQEPVYEEIVECDILNEKKELTVSLFSCNFCEVRNRAKILPKCMECGNPGGYMVPPYLSKKKNSLVHSICAFFSADYIIRPLKSLGFIQKPMVLKTFLKKNCFFCDLPIKRSLKCLTKTKCAILAHFFCFKEERTKFICGVVDRNSDQLWDFWYSFDSCEFDLPDSLPDVENFVAKNDKGNINNKFSKLVSSIFVKRNRKTNDYFDLRIVEKFDHFFSFFKKKLEMKILCNNHSLGKRKNCYCNKNLSDFILCDCCGTWYHKQCELENFNEKQFICKKCCFFRSLEIFENFEEPTKINETLNKLYDFFKKDKFYFHEFLFLGRFLETLLEKCDFTLIQNAGFFFMLMDQIKFENSFFGKFEIKKIVSIINPLLHSDFSNEYFNTLKNISPEEIDQKDPYSYLSEFSQIFFKELTKLFDNNLENLNDFEQKSKLFLKTNYDIHIKKQIRKLINLHKKLNDEKSDFKTCLNIIKEICYILKNKDIDNLFENFLNFFEEKFSFLNQELDKEKKIDLFDEIFLDYFAKENKNQFINIVLKKLFDLRYKINSKELNLNQKLCLENYFVFEKKVFSNSNTDRIYYKEFLKKSEIILSFNFDNFLKLGNFEKIDFFINNQIFELDDMSLFLQKFENFSSKHLFKQVQERHCFLSKNADFIDFKKKFVVFIQNVFENYFKNPFSIHLNQEKLEYIKNNFFENQPQLILKIDEFLNSTNSDKNYILKEIKNIFKPKNNLETEKFIGDSNTDKNLNQLESNLFSRQDPQLIFQNNYNKNNENSHNVIENKNTKRNSKIEIDLEQNCDDEKTFDFYKIDDKIEIEEIDLQQNYDDEKKLEFDKIQDKMELEQIDLDEDIYFDINEKEMMYENTNIDFLLKKIKDIKIEINEIRNWEIILKLIKIINKNEIKTDLTKNLSIKKQIEELLLIKCSDFKKIVIPEKKKKMIKKAIQKYIREELSKITNYEEILKKLKLKDLINSTNNFESLKKDLSIFQKLILKNPIKDLKAFLLNDFCVIQNVPNVLNLSLVLKNIKKFISPYNLNIEQKINNFINYCEIILIYQNIFLGAKNSIFTISCEVIENKLIFIKDKFCLIGDSRIKRLFDCLNFYLENENLLKKEVFLEIPKILSEEFLERKKHVKLIEIRFENYFMNFPFFKNQIKGFLQEKLDLINFHILLKKELIKFAGYVKKFSNKLTGAKIQEKELLFQNLKQKILSLNFVEEKIISKFLYLQYIFLFLKIKTSKKITKELLVNYLKLGMKSEYISENIFYLTDKINSMLKTIYEIEDFVKKPITSETSINIKEILNCVEENQIPQYQLNLSLMRNLKKTFNILKKKKKSVWVYKKHLQALMDFRNQGYFPFFQKDLEEALIKPFKIILQIKKLCYNYNYTTDYLRRFIFEKIGSGNFFVIDEMKESFAFFAQAFRHEPKVSFLRKQTFEEFEKLIENYEILSECLRLSKTFQLLSKICLNLYKKKIKIKIGCMIKFFEFIEKIYVLINFVYLEENENYEQEIELQKKFLAVIYFQLLNILIKSEEFYTKNKKNEFSYDNIIFVGEKNNQQEKETLPTKMIYLKNLNFEINKKFLKIQKENLSIQDNSKLKTLEDISKFLTENIKNIKDDNEKENIVKITKNLIFFDTKRYEKHKKEFLDLIKNIKVEKSIIYHIDLGKIPNMFDNKNKENSEINFKQIKMALLTNKFIDKENFQSYVISFAKKIEIILKSNSFVNIDVNQMFLFFNKNEKIMKIINDFVKGRIMINEISEKIKKWEKEYFEKKKKIVMKKKNEEEFSQKKNKRFTLFEDSEMDVKKIKIGDLEELIENEGNFANSLKKLKNENETIFEKKESPKKLFKEIIPKIKKLTKNETKLLAFGEKFGIKLKSEKKEILKSLKIYTTFSENILENFPNINYTPFFVLKTDQEKTRKWSKTILHFLNNQKNDCFTAFSFLNPFEVFEENKFHRFCFFGNSTFYDFYLFHFSHFLYFDTDFFNTLQIKLINQLLKNMDDINNLFIFVFVKKTKEKINPNSALEFKNLKTENFEFFNKEDFLKKLDIFKKIHGWSKNKKRPQKTQKEESETIEPKNSFDIPKRLSVQNSQISYHNNYPNFANSYPFNLPHNFNPMMLHQNPYNHQNQTFNMYNNPNNMNNPNYLNNLNNMNNPNYLNNLNNKNNPNNLNNMNNMPFFNEEKFSNPGNFSNFSNTYFTHDTNLSYNDSNKTTEGNKEAKFLDDNESNEEILNHRKIPILQKFNLVNNSSVNNSYVININCPTPQSHIHVGNNTPEFILPNIQFDSHKKPIYPHKPPTPKPPNPP